MAEASELKAQAREGKGKGAARAIRRAGRIPAVVYGDKQPPQPISLDYIELTKHVNTGTFLSTLFMVDVDGTKTRAIPRDIQFDPVRDFPMHVDFLRLGEGAKITIEVPVHFLNEEECPGLKQGGVLNVVRYTVEMLCPADNIPEGIDADLTGLELGESLHISAITLPEDIELTITDRDFTVATIAAPAALLSAEEEEEAAALAEAEAAEAAEGEEGVEGVEGEQAAETSDDTDKD